MDFKDTLIQLAERIEKQKDCIATEEAAKNAFIMPMIASLGYDVFNPFEVVPELDCDIAKKKGEKIDYAIIKDEQPIILIECKHCSQKLDLHNTQLKKYFVASYARFGVLTNGIEWNFYTDLEKPNIMDDKPFLTVNMLDLNDEDIEQLKKFHKSYYNVSSILDTAQELKYLTQIKTILASEFQNPSKEFVKYIAKQVYEGPIVESVTQTFTPIIRKAINSIITDTISSRLNLAIKTNQDCAEAQNSIVEEAISEKLADGVVFMDKEKGIVTTQEEIDCYHIVKAILRPVVDVSRVFYRDAQSYFAILLDDNNRKPICRMYLNAKSVKYIALFDENKVETRYQIQSLDDIYNYTEQLRKTVSYYK